MSRLALLAVLVLVPLRFASSQSRARIYVYAQREAPARSWRMMRCDGMPVAKIKRGRFFAINVAAGRHVLSSADGIPAFVDIRDGDESFVRLSWQQEIGEAPTLVLDKVPAVVAHNEMRFVIYIDPKEALSGSVPKTDPRLIPEPHFQRREDSSSHQ